MDAGSIAVSYCFCTAHTVLLKAYRASTRVRYPEGGLFRGMYDRSNITLKDIEMSRVEANGNYVGLQRQAHLYGLGNLLRAR